MVDRTSLVSVSDKLRFRSTKSLSAHSGCTRIQLCNFNSVILTSQPQRQQDEVVSAPRTPKTNIWRMNWNFVMVVVRQVECNALVGVPWPHNLELR